MKKFLIVLGAVIGILAYLWKGNFVLGAVVGVAMAANVVIAGLAGGAIPLVLRRYGLDPALSSAVFVTTVTDVAGFLIFLGLAAALITSLL